MATPGSIERDLKSSLHGFKMRAQAVKDAHRVARQKTLDDDMASELAKNIRIADLDKQTRSQLDGIRDQQEAYVRGLRDNLERELRGYQPADANNVLLRRDAADRARRITDEAEALAVLDDAARSGDDTLAHAVGHRARHSGWVEVSDAYRQAHPESADSAVALAFVEGLASDPGYNLANGITYAAP